MNLLQDGVVLPRRVKLPSLTPNEMMHTPEAQKKDKELYRATYGQVYPTSIVFIDSKWTQNEISNEKVNFLTTKKTYSDIAFATCQFRIGRRDYVRESDKKTITVEQLTLENLTFKNCHFTSCFMGDIKFENIRFVDCTFDRCDFGQSSFSDCAFVDVQIKDCTGWFIRFSRTTIDPRSLISGLRLPVRNYVGHSEELKESLKKNIESLEATSDQLCDSLSNTTRPGYFDKALFYSKYYGFYHRLNNLLDFRRYGRLYDEIFARGVAISRDLFWLTWNGFNLLLTRGGTSLTPLLFVLAVTSLLIFPFQISPRIDVEYQGSKSYLLNASYTDLIVVGLELFLAFGYTNFKAMDVVSHRALVMYATSGVLWYAFLVPVLLRRVYK